MCFEIPDHELDTAVKMELFERRRRRRLWRHFPLFVTDAHKFWRVQSDPPSRSTRVLMIEFWGKMRRRWWVGGFGNCDLGLSHSPHFDEFVDQTSLNNASDKKHHLAL